MAWTAIWLYIGALAVMAGPQIPFNRFALVIVAAWSVAHLAVMWGADYRPVQCLQYLAGGGVAALMMHNRASRVVTGLYGALLAVSLLDLYGAIEPTLAFWLIYSLAVMQLIVLPFLTDWVAIKAGWEGVLEMEWLDRLLMKRHG